MVFIACCGELMPERADNCRRLCDVYRYIAGQALLMTSQNMLRTEYLLPTDNIIVNA